MSNSRDIVDWETTLRILRDLMEAHSAVGRAGDIVVVGGSAMLAHQIRISSGDVDVYSPVFDPDVVQDIEERYQSMLGKDFRIDATSVENLWGNLLVRDIITESQPLETLSTSSGPWKISMLSAETLFLVKMEAGRQKDMEDLCAIALKTDPIKLANRFVQMAPWHGVPDAVMGFADRLIEKSQQYWGTPPAETLDHIAGSLPRRAYQMLLDAWDTTDNDALSAEHPALKPTDKESAADLVRAFHNGMLPRPDTQSDGQFTGTVRALVKDANALTFALVESDGKTAVRKTFAVPVSDADRDRLVVGDVVTFEGCALQGVFAIPDPSVPQYLGGQLSGYSHEVEKAADEIVLSMTPEPIDPESAPPASADSPNP